MADEKKADAVEEAERKLRARIVAFIRAAEAPTGDGFGPYGRAMTERIRWHAEAIADAIARGEV